MSRNLCEVIDNMLAEIPKTEVDFIASLESARSSAAFTSPETLSLRWETTVYVIQEHLPKAEPHLWEEWQLKVLDAWQGNSDWRNEWVIVDYGE